jgi:membrane-bound lytic murein transglycosylase B
MVSQCRWIVLSAALCAVACSSAESPAADSAAPVKAQAETPAPTVFDPLTQQIDRAREVQGTVDRQADATRQSVEAAERGDTPP